MPQPERNDTGDGKNRTITARRSTSSTNRAPRAALYHRVSTVDQNPAAARIELRRAARALGTRVVLDIEEHGSGANSNRPGLVRVVEAARRREIEVLLVWKVDRFARSTLDLLSRLRELESCGVRFIATTQALDNRADH